MYKKNWFHPFLIPSTHTLSYSLLSASLKNQWVLFTIQFIHVIYDQHQWNHVSIEMELSGLMILTPIFAIFQRTTSKVLKDGIIF